MGPSDRISTPPSGTSIAFQQPDSPTHSSLSSFRSSMGFLEFGNLHLHPLCRHPPEPGGPHLQGEVGEPGPVDPGAGAGKRSSLSPSAVGRGQRGVMLITSCCLLVASVSRRWATPKPGVCTRPSCPSASSGRRLTSLLRSSSGTSMTARSTWTRSSTSRC